MITSPGTTPPPRYIRTQTWGCLPPDRPSRGREHGHTGDEPTVRFASDASRLERGAAARVGERRAPRGAQAMPPRPAVTGGS